MQVYDIEQRSTEWHLARMGKFTASTFHKLFSKKDSAGYNELINTIVYERLTNDTPEGYTNEWMQRGIELEDEARIDYEVRTANIVDVVGFISLTDWVGVSPDGLVNDVGMVEIKCPKFSTLIDYHLKDKIPNNYYWQMQGQMWVAGREWNDFYAFHPKLKPFLKRVQRDEGAIEKLENVVELAIQEVKKRIEKLS